MRPTALLIAALSLMGLLALVPGFIAPDFGLVPLTSRPTKDLQASTLRAQSDDARGLRDQAVANPKREKKYLRVRLEMLGIPTDIFGIGLFLLIGSTAMLWRRRRSQDTVDLGPLLFVLSIISMAGVLWCVYQLMFSWFLIVPRYQVAIVAVLLILASTAGAVQNSLRESLRQLRLGAYRMLVSPAPWTAAVGLLVVVQLSSRAGAQMRTDPSVPSGKQFLSWFAQQPRVPGLPENSGIVTVVKFNDFQCPPCKRADVAYRQLFETFTRTKKVQLIEFDYPLESECNQFVKSSIHPAACEAAAAMRLARSQGHPEPLRAWLWENQAKLTPDLVRQAAREIAGIETFDQLYREALQQVRTDVALGNKVGVAGTPTFFINGKLIRAIPVSDLEAAIRFELDLIRR